MTGCRIVELYRTASVQSKYDVMIIICILQLRLSLDSIVSQTNEVSMMQFFTSFIVLNIVSKLLTHLALSVCHGLLDSHKKRCKPVLKTHLSCSHREFCIMLLSAFYGPVYTGLQVHHKTRVEKWLSAERLMHTHWQWHLGHADSSGWLHSCGCATCNSSETEHPLPGKEVTNHFHLQTLCEQNYQNNLRWLSNPFESNPNQQ